MPPVVSIGLLTHNYGRYIRTALDSVLAQTFTDWELLVSDDCSTDDTAEVVRPYLADPRVRYVRHSTNLRQGGNWAYAIGQGTADRIATLHADDWWLPDALAMAMAAFDAEPMADLICGPFLRVGTDGTPLDGGRPAIPTLGPATSDGGPAAYVSEARSFTCLPSSTLFSRAAVARAGLPRADFDMLVDVDFFLRIVAVARRLVRLPRATTMYRCHGGGVTAATTGDGRLVAELRRLPGIAAGHPGATPGTVAAIRRGVARSLYSSGLNQTIDGDPEGGSAVVRTAWRQDCRLLATPKYLVDLLLTFAGPVGTSLLQRLHPSRVPRPPAETN